MKRVILLGAVLAGTAHAQMYMNSEYGSPQPNVIQPGNVTVYTDRYGQPIATAIQQPQQQPTPRPDYSIYSSSQYTPNSISREQQYDRYQQQQRRYGN